MNTRANVQPVEESGKKDTGIPLKLSVWSGSGEDQVDTEIPFGAVAEWTDCIVSELSTKSIQSGLPL